ncbi:hypothetical protein OHA61_15770 [Streptomyces sp. NBC_00885]|uniref:hypothetical protein n=1 Tax=Streptomyces sp. NBC_00885 TaxID=2975857 RepID=UPI00386E6BB8|nr:hypothetical protein OHA61_15770 [Streptomyces sp. NBC_00885]
MAPNRAAWGLAREDHDLRELPRSAYEREHLKSGDVAGSWPDTREAPRAIVLVV